MIINKGYNSNIINYLLKNFDSNGGILPFHYEKQKKPKFIYIYKLYLVIVPKHTPTEPLEIFNFFQKNIQTNNFF